MNWTINTRTEQLQRHATQVRRRSRHLWRRLALMLAVLGPGLITSNVDNDAGRHLHVFAGRRAVRLRAAVVADSDDHRAVRDRRDVRAHGRGHGQGAFRPDPRGVWLPADVFRDGDGFSGGSGQRGGGVRRAWHRRWRYSAISRYIAVPIAGLVVWVLVLRGTYRQVEKIFLALCTFYLAYAVFRHSGQARIGWMPRGIR